MKEFDFTLKFALASSVWDAEQYVERLGEAGCDDAIIGIGQKGRIAFEFCRVSDNAFDAVVSAIKDIKGVIPDAKLIEAVPDLVGLSDIAHIVGVSRQNIRKLMLTHIHTFPAPIHAGSSSIWHLSDVLQWFEEKQKKTIQGQVREIAEVNMQVNLARASEKADPKYKVELASLAM